MKAGPIIFGWLRLPRAGEWGFGPGAFTHCLGYTPQPRPRFHRPSKTRDVPVRFSPAKGALKRQRLPSRGTGLRVKL